MIKWLSVSLIVLATFALILLGFGALLNDNEKKHEAYNRKLEQVKREQQQSNSDQLTTVVSLAQPTNIETQTSINLTIVANNLTCVVDEQCALVDLTFADLSCTVAVNIIGEAQLKKAEPDKTSIGQCDHSAEINKAVCLDNFCTLAASN